MAAADLTDGVAVRFSALCLDAGGRLGDYSVWNDAVRGGLLLDLALAGRLESLEDSIVVDETPTGFLPADRLLLAIGAEPERSLDGWLGERRLGMRDVVAANVASGRWELRRDLLGFRRRYIDLHRAATVADARRGIDSDPEGWSPADACVVVLSAATGLHVDVPAPPVEAAIRRTGPVEWLCEAVVDHLRRAAAQYGAEASGLGPL